MTVHSIRGSSAVAHATWHRSWIDKNRDQFFFLKIQQIIVIIVTSESYFKIGTRKNVTRWN